MRMNALHCVVLPCLSCPRLEFPRSKDPSCSLSRLAQAAIFYFSRLQNLGTELPYGSGMAYGRCDRVLDSIYPPSPHTSPG